eukprot:g61133.t1
MRAQVPEEAPAEGGVSPAGDYWAWPGVLATCKQVLMTLRLYLYTQTLFLPLLVLVLSLAVPLLQLQRSRTRNEWSQPSPCDLLATINTEILQRKRRQVSQPRVRDCQGNGSFPAIPGGTQPNSTLVPPINCRSEGIHDAFVSKRFAQNLWNSLMRDHSY